MLKVSIKQFGKKPQRLIFEEKQAFNILLHDLISLGQKTHSFMIDYIKDNEIGTKATARNSKSLKESIDFDTYYTQHAFGWSIGNIQKLNDESPHWHLINYGGKHPQAGKSIPGFFEDVDVFLYAPYSGEFITVGINTVIEPMGYIEATRDFLDREILTILNKYTSR